MKSPETLLMERRANWYLDFVNNGEEDCINRRLSYEIVACSYEMQELILSFETTNWMMNPGGVVHGGMICTMFDITMGITSLALSGTFTPTVNLSVSYLSPVPLQDYLIIKAHATRVGKTFVQLTAEATSKNTRTLCATATAIFYCAGQEKLIFND
ncbi:MAG: PaaI family thioesterase [Candidatus Fimivivens sp.]